MYVPCSSGGIGVTESQQQAVYPQAAYPSYTYPLAATSLPKPEVKDEDSDDEHLVVDEAPQKSQKRTLSDKEVMRGDISGQGMDSGHLRLKLSSEQTFAFWKLREWGFYLLIKECKKTKA